MNNSEISNLYVGSTQVKEVRKGSSLVAAPNGDALWYKANEVPSLDLRFAESKSLVDATTGSNLVDFTRASSGTYVGSDGLIKTATTNLLTYSEDFGTGWTAASGTVITTNATSNPINNLTDADKLAVGTSSFPQIIQSLNTTVANAHTFSAYVKADGVNFVQLRVRNTGATSNYFRAIFNLTDGNITQNTAFGNGTYTSGSAVSVGNGWWRLSIAGIADTSGTQATVLIILTSDEDGNVATPSTNDATDGIYLWGAQLEQSSTVGEYVKTTSTINSAPRFDHDPTTGESLGLLVEESRTNLAVYSEDLTNLTPRFNLILTSKTDTTCPVTSTVYDIQSDNGTQTYVAYTANVTSGITYTVSRFVRYVSGSEVYGFAAFSFFPTFQGFLGFAETSPGNLSVDNSSIQSYQYFGNGWYRIIITDTASASGTVTIQNSINTPANYPNANTGLQFEAGSFPTSYIPTEGSTVTRAADVASISGSNFSDWYNQSEGTVFADYDIGGGVQPRYPFSISDDTTLNRFNAFNSGSTNLNFRLVSGSAIYNPGVLSVNASGNSKITLAARVASNGTIGSSNGALSTPGSPLAMPVVDRMYIGLAHNGLEPLNGAIKRLTYWPQRLPNETLQTITQ